MNVGLPAVFERMIVAANVPITAELLFTAGMQDPSEVAKG